MSYHPTLTAAVAAEYHRDRVRSAERSRLIADLPDRPRHRVSRRRPAWWIRVATTT